MLLLSKHGLPRGDVLVESVLVESEGVRGWVIWPGAVAGQKTDVELDVDPVSWADIRPRRSGAPILRPESGLVLAGEVVHIHEDGCLVMELIGGGIQLLNVAGGVRAVDPGDHVVVEAGRAVVSETGV